MQAAIRTTVDKFGRFDVLHNNVGGSTPQDDTAVNAPLDEFWRAIKSQVFPSGERRNWAGLPSSKRT